MIDAHAEVENLGLDEVIARLEQPREMLQLLGGMLEQYESDIFNTGGRGTWAENDAVTAEAKNSGRVLVDTGNLLRELTHSRVDGDDAVVVDQGDAYYGIFHQQGDRGMPTRDPAPEPHESDVDQWVERLVTFILDGTS
ncbi:hypothetical protein ABFU82_22560 [Nocardioides sp. WV_118_6]